MNDTGLHWREAQQALARGDVALAVTALEKTVAENPANVEAYRTLGRVLRLSGRPDDAAACYRRLLQVAPGDAVAVMGLAALGKGSAPARLPDEVVRYVFDGNATTYESNMQALGYRVPEFLGGLLREDAVPADRTLDVLDLGCGSGLCAPLLRPFARRLAGVDLCRNMLALARAKNLYDELVEAELLQYLATVHDSKFDVVVAANVLIYFGEIGELCAGVARALRRGGRFVFDVEKGEGAQPGFHVSGRYTHSHAVVANALAGTGLVLARVDEAVMRKEQGTPVAALCCLAVQQSGSVPEIGLPS
jgi:predicted TPR repeat methyltransferase